MHNLLIIINSIATQRKFCKLETCL